MLEEFTWYNLPRQEFSCCLIWRANLSAAWHSQILYFIQDMDVCTIVHIVHIHMMYMDYALYFIQSPHLCSFLKVLRFFVKAHFWIVADSYHVTFPRYSLQIRRIFKWFTPSKSYTPHELNYLHFNGTEMKAKTQISLHTRLFIM